MLVTENTNAVCLAVNERWLPHIITQLYYEVYTLCWCCGAHVNFSVVPRCEIRLASHTAAVCLAVNERWPPHNMT